MDFKLDGLRGHSKAVRIMMNLRLNVEISIKCLEAADTLVTAKLVVRVEVSVEAVEVKDLVEVKASEVVEVSEAKAGLATVVDLVTEVAEDLVIVEATMEVLEVVEAAVDSEAMEAVEATKILLYRIPFFVRIKIEEREIMSA